MSTVENAADIIIPVHNGYSHTRDMIENIYRFTDLPFHLYIIDNESTDETVDLGRIYTQDITIIRNRHNQGWGISVNGGVPPGINQNIVFMRNDVAVSKGWLENMLVFLDTHPRIGAVGTLGSDSGDPQFVDNVRRKFAPQIPLFKTCDIHERNRILNYHFPRAGILIDGALSFFCVAMKRRTIREVGLPEEPLGDGKTDAAYCRKLRKAGYVLGLSLATYVVRRTESGKLQKAV